MNPTISIASLRDRPNALKTTMKRASPLPDLDGLIITVRHQPVILDRDLARLYEVPTFRFNEAVKRNADRFPADFKFRLSLEEWAAAKQQTLSAEHGGGGTKDAPANSSQNATSAAKHRGAAYLPWAFTEHGAIMAATVLKSRRAVGMKMTSALIHKSARGGPPAFAHSENDYFVDLVSFCSPLPFTRRQPRKQRGAIDQTRGNRSEALYRAPLR